MLQALTIGLPSPNQLQVLTRFAWFWTFLQAIRICFLPSGKIVVIVSYIYSAPFLEARHHLGLPGFMNKTKQNSSAHITPKPGKHRCPVALSLGKLSLHFNKTSRCLSHLHIRRADRRPHRVQGNQLASAGLIPSGRGGNSLRIIFQVRSKSLQGLHFGLHYKPFPSGCGNRPF